MYHDVTAYVLIEGTKWHIIRKRGALCVELGKLVCQYCRHF